MAAQNRTMEACPQMGLNLVNLDSDTRRRMVAEIDADIAQGALYVSDRLNANGKRDYPSLLKQAAQSETDDWLANEIRPRLNAMYPRRNSRTGGMDMARMPHNAHETMAEGEFNRFYLRALCLRAIEQNISHLVVYRARRSMSQRSTSMMLEGTQIDPRALLNDLRASVGTSTAGGVPGGPNSGLSARLP